MARRTATARLTSGLQPEEINALAAALREYRFWPVEFATNVIGLQLDPWQAAVARAAARTARANAGLERPSIDMQQIAVASSTGVGKDTIASVLGLWFLVTFENPKIIVTAPSDDQMDDVIWPEFAKWINFSPILPDIVEWQAESIVHRGNPTNAFISRRTARVSITAGGERHAEGLSGVHEDNVLVIFDESPGIQDEVWNALLPTLSGANNVALAFGNPNRTSGKFFQIWYDPNEAELWTRFRIASEPWPKEFGGQQPDFISDRPSEHVKAKLRALPLYDAVRQSKLYGRHPVGTATNVIYTYDEITEAMRRPEWPLAPEDRCQIGVDVARMGSDRTVYCVRRGYNITDMIVQAQSPATLVEDTIKELCEREGALTFWLIKGGDRMYRHDEFGRLDQVERLRYYPRIVLDMGGGYGSTIYDNLVADGYTNVEGVQFGSDAWESERFANLAAEMWCETLKALMPYLHLPKVEALRTQLTSRPYDFDRTDGERMRVLDKREMRRRGLPSPDEADALCLSVVEPPSAGVF